MTHLALFWERVDLCVVTWEEVRPWSEVRFLLSVFRSPHYSLRASQAYCYFCSPLVLIVGFTQSCDVARDHLVPLSPL